MTANTLRRPPRGLDAVAAAAAGLLLTLTACSAQTQQQDEDNGSLDLGVPSLDLGGGVEVQPIKILDPTEISDKWWFWLIIGIVGLFCLVMLFFVWRGVKQWRLHKAHEAECEEKERQQEAAAGGKGALPPGARAALPPGWPAADVEAAPTDLCSCEKLPPEEAAAWLQERERRTAVHPKRKW